MKIRRALLAIALVLGLLATPLAVDAQEPAKTTRIGFLGSASASGYATMLDALRTGLREFGYLEGKDFVFEFRWAEEKYDRLPGLAANLVHLNVAVLMTHGTPAIRAAKQATRTVPIVMVTSSDAVASGLVASLARPGGNITGSTLLNPEINAKRLEILKETFPRARRVAVLLNPGNPSNGPIFRAMEASAKSLKLALERFEVRESNEFEGAFLAMAKRHVDAVTISQDAVFFENAKVVAEMVTKTRLPSAGFKEYADAGGLIGYGPNYLGLYRRSAYFVDKILKGAKPGDLPVEQPTKFELVINLKAAKTLGLTIPPSLLLRADQVIE